MSYSQLFFGKELDLLSYDDIEAYFQETRDESNKIEYKSYSNAEEKNHTEKQNGVVRAICALLNSEGGLVIWGAPEGQKVDGKKEKIFQGGLSPVENLIEKDRFINTVTDLITPSPRGIQFKALDKEGKYVYILEVDQSMYSPHQFRNVYYMRIDGQTKPAPHHYIEALMKRIQFPNLVGYLKFEKYQVLPKDIRQLRLSVGIWNLSKFQNDFNVTYRLLSDLGQFRHWDSYMTNKPYEYQGNGHLRIYHNLKDIIHYGEPVMDTVNIEFNASELHSNNYETELNLLFAAKNSPMKTSIYKLKLGPDSPDLNSCFIEKDENIFMYQLKEKIGITEQEGIEKILGRKV
jgi:hypothetical protein